MTGLSTCKSCGAPTPAVILSLGKTPLANGLLRQSQLRDPEPEYPLDLFFCPACSMVQIGHIVPPQVLFGHYPYFSSVSVTTVARARELAERLIETRRLDSTSRVIEIASNDGYLLQWYARQSVPVLGVEPARNIAEASEKRGIPTIREFFSYKLAQQLSSSDGRADVIHANNVLAHVPDLDDFIKGISVLLKPEGVVVIEVPYVKDLVDRNAFDTIYHEHVWYFSLTSLQRVLARQGLKVIQLERISMHGGSLRLFATHETASDAPETDLASVRACLDEESQSGLDHLQFYAAFSGRVAKLREQLCRLIHRLKADGKKVAAYGASAKGTVLLNYCGIDRNVIDFVVDRSPFKQQFFTPGTRLPIRSPNALLQEMPDYVLLLTWNFADEILQQQSVYRNHGGRFIIPIPDVQIV